MHLTRSLEGDICFLSKLIVGRETDTDALTGVSVVLATWRGSPSWNKTLDGYGVMSVGVYLVRI